MSFYRQGPHRPIGGNIAVPLLTQVIANAFKRYCDHFSIEAEID